MKIVVVGLGYVGLSNAVLLAQQNEVIGIDISQERVDAVNAGKSPIFDAELSEYLSKKNLDLLASKDFEQSVVDADYVIVSTPTDYNEIKNYFDTSSVEAVIEKVLKYEPEACIVIKSTVPIGFIDTMRKRYEIKKLFFSPEFLREGRALHDTLYPSRIIIGDKSRKAKKFANMLKNSSLRPEVEILYTGSREAEAIKLFVNANLAMRVAFFNELDSYAMEHCLDSLDIIKGISSDPRIGTYYNNPSFGYGGYCLPKDTKQLLANYDTLPQKIIQAIVESNSTRKDFLTDKIMQHNPNLVGIFRLNMKSGSDNFRNSASEGIIKRLHEKGIKIIIYEPNLYQENYLNCEVVADLSAFKKRSNIIVTNRYCKDLADVYDKIFTRDLFGDN